MQRILIERWSDRQGIRLCKLFEGQQTHPYKQKLVWMNWLDYLKKEAEFI